ncbi:hypothetical protein BDFB_003128 [Asbolus verrucosus]|uniref:Uncharacterized protein n=1 Tax=Asbolus verrucosus TaxID=1661398 RepID=A0A482W4Z2_ASBVE|nr:hypothetical protein BDFB_003128 [Asbolus verrucosus]
MDYLLLWLLFTSFPFSFCATIEKHNSEPEAAEVRTDKSRAVTLRDFMTCGLTRNISCFLDTADAALEEKRTQLLAEADREVLKAKGRANDEESPSQLSKAISRIISELTDMFKEGLWGFFKRDREGEDDEVEANEEESDDETEPEINTKVAESRGKKKKKLVGLIKLILIGLALFLKLKLLLKLLAAALQVKFFLVALAQLILNAARFYLDLKKKHQPQKVIYYEHAQHQHHYDGGEEDWVSSGPGGGYWGRSYDEEGENGAQNLAYAKQKPTPYSRVDKNKSAFSWFG